MKHDGRINFILQINFHLYCPLHFAYCFATFVSLLLPHKHLQNDYGAKQRAFSGHASQEPPVSLMQLSQKDL